MVSYDGMYVEYFFVCTLHVHRSADGMSYVAYVCMFWTSALFVRQFSSMMKNRPNSGFSWGCRTQLELKNRTAKLAVGHLDLTKSQLNRPNSELRLLLTFCEFAVGSSTNKVTA